MSITCKSLDHIYGYNTPFEYYALKNVNLKIEKGSFTAIIGQTGSGKSTLIQHINALLLPTSGEIKIDDYIILEKLLGLNIAEYFQKYALKYFEENEENDLLKIILKCFGNFNQCRILMIVVNRFEELMRCYHVVDQKHVRNVYIALLDDLIQEHNKRYTKVLDSILNDLTKNTDIDDCIKTIELQRKEIAEERIWDFCLNKTEENKRLARYFASTSDKDDIMNILTKCRKRFGRADECFQYLVHSVHENGIGESAISYDIECRKKIQRNVILENYNRYMK